MFSIALALLLFVLHQRGAIDDRFFSVPLQFEIEPNIVPASAYPQTIRVSVRGDRGVIRSLNEGDVEPYIDLKGKGRGIYRAPVQFRKRGVAAGIEPLEITVDPLEISITLDNKMSKYVPVKAAVRGGVKEGYELVSAALNPEQVILDGPSDLVSGIAGLSTDGIDLDGRSGDFSIMVTIVNQNPLLAIRGTGMTEFQGTIRQIMGLGNFDGLPITLRGLRSQFSGELEIKTGMVRMGGNQQDIETYTPPEDFLIADCSAITQPGTYSLTVSAQPPAGFTLLRQEPEKVTVHIRENRSGL
jgi:hypothetical protein